LEPSDQLATPLELAGRGTGSLETTQLGHLCAQMGRDPPERAIDLSA
jgi:hypothetical protein